MENMESETQGDNTEIPAVESTSPPTSSPSDVSVSSVLSNYSVPWRPPFSPEERTQQNSSVPVGCPIGSPPFPRIASGHSLYSPAFWSAFHQLPGSQQNDATAGFAGSSSSNFPFSFQQTVRSHQEQPFSYRPAPQFFSPTHLWNGGSSLTSQHFQPELSPNRKPPFDQLNHLRQRTVDDFTTGSVSSRISDPFKTVHNTATGRAKTVRELLMDRNFHLTTDYEYNTDSDSNQHESQSDSLDQNTQDSLTQVQDSVLQLETDQALAASTSAIESESDTDLNGSDFSWPFDFAGVHFDSFENQFNQSGLFDCQLSGSVESSSVGLLSSSYNQYAQQQMVDAGDDQPGGSTGVIGSSFDSPSSQESVFSSTPPGMSPYGRAQRLGVIDGAPSASYGSSTRSSYSPSPPDLHCYSPMPPLSQPPLPSCQSLTTPHSAIPGSFFCLPTPKPLSAVGSLSTWSLSDLSAPTPKIAVAKVTRASVKAKKVPVGRPCPRPRMFGVSQFAVGRFFVGAENEPEDVAKLYRVKIVFSARKIIYEFESKHVPGLPDEVRESLTMAKINVPWSNIQGVAQRDDEFIISMTANPIIFLGCRHNGNGLGLTYTKYDDRKPISNVLLPLNWGQVRMHKLVLLPGQGCRFRDALNKTGEAVLKQNAWQLLNVPNPGRVRRVAQPAAASVKKCLRKRKASEETDLEASVSTAKRGPAAKEIV